MNEKDKEMNGAGRAFPIIAFSLSLFGLISVIGAALMKEWEGVYWGFFMFIVLFPQAWIKRLSLSMLHFVSIAVVGFVGFYLFWLSFQGILTLIAGLAGIGACIQLLLRRGKV